MQSLLHIQVVQGNPHLRSLLGWHLQQAGCVVHLSSGCHQAQELFQTRHPDLVILDTDLPDGSGLELCRWLRRHQEILIFMLSARDQEADVVAGLKAGADDYLTKPFGIQEFLARIETLTRRAHPVLPAYLNFGDLQIDLVQRRVFVRQQPVDLTPQEFSLLYVLTQAGGHPLTRQELLIRAWPDYIDNTRTVDTHILSLRKKIELDSQHPRIIQTIRNVGYRLNMDFLNVTHHRQMTMANLPKTMPPKPAPLSQTRT